MPRGSYAVLGQSFAPSENFHYLKKMRYSIDEVSSAAATLGHLG